MASQEEALVVDALISAPTTLPHLETDPARLVSSSTNDVSATNTLNTLNTRLVTNLGLTLGILTDTSNTASSQAGSSSSSHLTALPANPPLDPENGRPSVSSDDYRQQL